MGWNVVPDGLREMLLWVTKRYNDPLIIITENGSAVHEPDLEAALHDEKRREYFEGHLRAVAEAIRSGVNVAGYFAWSLMDNFEWQFGYDLSAPVPAGRVDGALDLLALGRHEILTYFDIHYPQIPTPLWSMLCGLQQSGTYSEEFGSLVQRYDSCQWAKY